MPAKFDTVSKSIYFSKTNDAGYFHNDYFLIKSKLIQKNDLNKKNLSKFFIGLVFTRKIANAVKRNKIRRRLKSIFQNSSGICIQNIVYILIAKKKITELSFDELRDILYNSILNINYRIYKKYAIKTDFIK